eukprot:Phypoly_transcript_02602.p1 GENE.Phypoly_transcript_02602~~Phypoly_transcript_02602.p1  ORF type:complete len:708 (+),score=104.49 Phypoly_transcript_02602:238-2361(+)
MSGRHASPRQTPKRGRGSSTVHNESPPPWTGNDKRIEQQLGPEWSQTEITTFFNAIKQGRTDWENIAAAMPGRSADSIRSLYNMQKNYLELEEASPLALYTILKSIYTTMPVFLSGADVDSESNTRRTRSKSTPKPKETPKTPIQKPQPVTRRTRKQLFPDDTPATPKRTSTNTSTTLRTPSPIKSTPRKRKPTSRNETPPVTPIRNTSSATSTPSATMASTPDSQLPLKLRGKIWKISPSRQDGTKNTPSSSAHVNDDVPSHRIVQDRLVNFFSSRSPRAHSKNEVILSASGRWAVYEWFYSDIDRVYFQVNDFQECLNDLGLSKVRKLTRVEWAHVRSAMGKPRRLSRAFLKQERTKLYNTRSNVRLMRQGETPTPSSTVDGGIVPTESECPSTLSVGTNVLVYHHKALKKGVVQAAEAVGARYRVLLDGNTTPIWIKDVDIMSMYDESEDGEESLKPSSVSKRRKVLDMTPGNGTSTPSRAYTREELINVASLVGLLEKKETLLSELTAMNNQAEKMLAQSQEYPSWFQQRYAVLIVKLEEVNRVLEPTLVRLHATRSSPPSGINPPIARTYTDISMLDFREQNWGETTIIDCKRHSQALVREQMPKYNVASVMRDYVSDCVCLLLQLQACANHVRNLGPDEAAADVITSLDYVLATVRPKSEENMPLYSEIEQSVTMLKNKLTSRNSSFNHHQDYSNHTITST